MRDGLEPDFAFGLFKQKARSLGARDDHRLRGQQVVNERRQVRAGGEQTLHQLGARDALLLLLLLFGVGPL